MKKQIAASVLAVAMAFTMLPTSAFASAEDALIPTAETTGEASNAANPSAAETGSNANGNPAPSTTEEEPSQEEKAVETGSSTNGKAAPSATEEDPSQEENAAETGSSTNSSPALSATEDEPSQEEKAAETGSSTNGSPASSATEDKPSQEEKAAETDSSTNGSPAPSATEDEPSQEDTSIAPFAETTYKVSDSNALDLALMDIEKRTETEATIVLTDNVTAPNAWDGDDEISFFGASGKHITVKSAGGETKELSFESRGMLSGDCTFDNVDVTGGSLFCNGHWTIFTDNGQIHLRQTLYGGGYKTTVKSTHVEIAASGSINPISYIGLHDVIGGSYQGSVEGDTYLKITGNIQMQSGNHLNPGCMKGNGRIGDDLNAPNVHVGGNATLIYDNKNADTSPAIEGTYDCEMQGDVTLDVRSGSVSGIVGTGNSSTSSIIHGNLHIIAGYPGYKKDTDPVLRLGNYNTIVGADNSSNIIDGSTVGRNITIDTYENVWGWDKNKVPDPDDNPLQIYGALYGTVGGDIIINAQGSHLTNIYGAGDSTVQGSVSVNATNVDLNDPYFVEGDVVGLWEYDKLCTVGGPVTVTVDGGDVGHVMVTTHTTVPAGSSIKVTRKPKIRDSICGAQSGASSANLPVANVSACEAEIPLIKKMSQVNITGNSKVTVQDMTDDAGLLVDEGSTLTTDLEPISIQGNTVINGTWEQLCKQTYGDSDIFVRGTTQIGPSGRLINHGTSNLKGTVINNGVMALMGSALFQGDYTANSGKLRLPAVAEGKNYNTGKIPLQINGLSTGTTTVYTVDPADWQTLKKPALGDNYILSKKNTDSPAQDVFVLGNADAVKDGWFLKRMADAAGSGDTYMWQVANSIRVVFDKNGGDTEASPRVMMQDKIEGAVNHFDLPTIEPTRSGCKFTGWNTKPDGTGEAFTAETDVTESLTVYAQWQPVSSTESGGNTGGNSGNTGGNTGGNSGSTGGNSGSTGSNSGSTGDNSGSTGGNSDSTGGNSGSTGGNSAAKAEQGSQPVSHAVSDAAASTGPRTGDASALSLWAAVMAVSILGLAGICMAVKVHHRSKK